MFDWLPSLELLGVNCQSGFLVDAAQSIIANMPIPISKKTKPPEDRDGFRFRAGHAALDLPATLAGRLKPVPRELLGTPEDLGRWLVAAGLAPSPPIVDQDDLGEARRLREAIYALAVRRIAGEALPAAALDVVNRAAAGRPAVARLDEAGGMRLVGSAKSLLTTLAHEAICMLGGEQADRIRQCESGTCALLFLDHSRSGDRRWCSMSGCGNKAKVAEFRRRKRLESGGP